MRPTPRHACDHEKVRELAAEIVGDEEDLLRRVGKLKDWLFTNIRQTSASNASSAIDVIARRAGDCTEITMLFVALARAAGIPARELGGIMSTGGDPSVFAWHAWAEVHDGRRWISVDATWNQVFVDATHIALQADEEDYSWVGLLGKLKIEILEVVRGEAPAEPPEEPARPRDLGPARSF